jgi:leukotriene-A4 hydrolase
MPDTDPDLSTQSNYGDIQTTHVDFDWIVDFDTKTISGSIKLTLKVKTDDLAKLLFVVLFYLPCLIYD